MKNVLWCNPVWFEIVSNFVVSGTENLGMSTGSLKTIASLILQPPVVAAQPEFLTPFCS